MLVTLAQELGKLPNKLSIERHTDSTAYAPTASYGNWELSADRANSARRLMAESGLRPDQVTQVRGFAAQRLRKPDAPEDPSNRRISIIVQYESKVREEDKSLVQKMHEKELKAEHGGEQSKKEPGEKKGDQKPEEKKPEEPKAPSKPQTVESLEPYRALFAGHQ